jgi:hypothetical protein
VRIGSDGQADQVLLLDQDRSRWDWLLVRRGLAALERAYATGGPIGPYTLQAAIAACHARARVAEDTDWERIVALYDGLAQLMPSPVVDLNRAVAFGPRAALESVDRLREEPALDGYHLLPTVRGDLLEKLGRLDEARGEFERAALLTANSRQRTALLKRAAACASQVDYGRRHRPGRRVPAAVWASEHCARVEEASGLDEEEKSLGTRNPLSHARQGPPAPCRCICLPDPSCLTRPRWLKVGKPEDREARGGRVGRFGRTAPPIRLRTATPSGESPIPARLPPPRRIPGDLALRWGKEETRLPGRRDNLGGADA